MKQPALLIINSGSSSVKFQVFAHNPDLALLAKGPQIAINQQCSQKEAIYQVMDWVNHQNKDWNLKAVGHRVVHGGTLFTESVLVNPCILTQLKQLNPLAPLHQPHNLAAIEHIAQMHPNLPQVACFDTAFHAMHTELFTQYALPKWLRNKGIRRYGFHGLSYEWIAMVLKQDYPELAQGKVIAAHLGNGASLCAMNNGVSIDTTMGLTALDGLPMGTRCGQLDPGAVLYMINELGLSASEIENLLYNDSGLLALSGQTNDVQSLEQSTNAEAQFALDFFCLKAAQYIGMMAIALDGVDAIIFTGGIGEHSEYIRKKILNKVQCLQPFTTLTIPAHEERIMAIHSERLTRVC